jgi:DNA-binding CsgD family transcriptional regulator
MQTGNSVIIHSSPVIQQGFKNILLSRMIGITELLSSFPENDAPGRWMNTLILADTQYSEKIEGYAKILRRNGNRIVGIESSGNFNDPDSAFDDILSINDNLDTIIQKLLDYISGLENVKSGNQLSSREIEVLKMVANGFSNKQIADQLFISIHTVIAHRKNLTFKLGIKSIPGLTLYAAMNNLVEFQR